MCWFLACCGSQSRPAKSEHANPIPPPARPARRGVFRFTLESFSDSGRGVFWFGAGSFPIHAGIIFWFVVFLFRFVESQNLFSSIFRFGDNPIYIYISIFQFFQFLIKPSYFHPRELILRLPTTVWRVDIGNTVYIRIYKFLDLYKHVF